MKTSPPVVGIKILALFVAVLLYAQACNRGKEMAEPDEAASLVLKVNPPLKIDPGKGLLKFSELFSDFEIIPLETTEENLTGRAITGRIIGDRIYVCDKSGNKSVDIYTLNGEFVVRIQNVGRGPGEYIRIYDYDVDMVTGDVMILDGIANKGLLVFDGNTGLYKKSIPLPPPGRFESFIKHGDKFLFHTGRGSADDPESAMLYVSNEKGELLEKHLFFSDGKVVALSGYTEAGGYNGRFYRTDDGIRIFCSWDNTIYSYNDGVVSRFLTIDDSDNEPPQQIMASLESVRPTIRPQSGTSLFTENETHIYFTYRLVSGFPANVIYNKIANSKEVYIGAVNDITFRGGGYFGIYGNHVVSSYYPGWGIEGNELIRDIRSGKIPMDSEKAERLIEKMKRNTEQGGGASNPILILYRLRD